MHWLLKRNSVIGFFNTRNERTKKKELAVFLNYFLAFQISTYLCPTEDVN